MARAAVKPVRHLSLAEASASLSKIARRTHDKGEYFFVSGNGGPAIGIMNAEEMEDYLEVRDRDVRRQIQKSNEDYVAGKSRPLAQFISEISRPKTKRLRAAGKPAKARLHG